MINASRCHQIKVLTLLLGLLSLSTLATTNPALAITPNFNLSVENDLSRKTVDPSEFPIVGLGFSAKSSEDETMSDSPNEYDADLLFRISPTHPKAHAITSKNFFWGEKDQSYDSPLRFSYGRRLIGWTRLDEMWNLGAIEPLDSWDRMRPEEQGLTGIFAYTETQKADFRLFVSYLALPETGPNVVLENEQFVNEHPQSITTAPQSFNLLNQPTPLGYELNIPSISKVIFRPSLMFMMETKREIPVYGKFVYGYLPLNYFPIALQASLSIPNRIVVPLTPRLLQHHVYNAEVGYRINDSLSFGITGLIDQPVSDQIPDQYTTTVLTTSYSTSPYLQYQTPNFKILLTHLWTTGGLDADTGPAANPDRSLFSSRILYRNATQISVRTKLGFTDPHSPTLLVKYIHEYAVLADWIAADIYFNFTPRLTAFVGGDVISARRDVAPDRGAEFLADIRAIDRIRVGATYAL
jgi:hypothetical protein